MVTEGSFLIQRAVGRWRPPNPRIPAGGASLPQTAPNGGLRAAMKSVKFAAQAANFTSTFSSPAPRTPHNGAHFYFGAPANTWPHFARPAAEVRRKRLNRAKTTVSGPPNKPKHGQNTTPNKTSTVINSGAKSVKQHPQ